MKRKKIKVTCISDLHGCMPELPGGDLLIVAGDLTAAHTVKEHTSFTEWYLKQDYRKRVLVAGNHDTAIENGEYYFNHDLLGYLCDSGTEFEGLKIWGSPWTHQFSRMNPRCMAFTVPMRSSLQNKWDLIPTDVDILVTHSPPFGILDQRSTEPNSAFGCIDLRKTLVTCIKPKLHVFGHIHENGGKKIIFRRPGIATENNTICVNAAYMSATYDPGENKIISLMI